MENKILYLCNRNKCENCNSECRYTQDINYAKNFQKIVSEDGVVLYQENLDFATAMSEFSRVMQKVSEDGRAKKP